MPAIAKEMGLGFHLFGGFDQAERQMAAFLELPTEAEYPILCLEAAFEKKYSQPSHRDVLGAILGLGIDRSHVGDILLEADNAYVFATEEMGPFIAENLMEAGRVPLHCALLSQLPELAPPKGIMRRDTVSSLRLDAIVAAALNLSRTRAVELIERGLVRVNHLPVEKGDARVGQGDMISLRGYGRVALRQVGAPTRKGRLPIELECFGKWNAMA